MQKNTQHIQSVSFNTLGCKLNQSETDAIRDKFIENGYEIKKFGETVDLTLINTCTVTNAADSDSRNLIRKAIRSSPEGRIAVTGCYAQINPDVIKEIPGVDLILGNDEKYKIFNYLDELKTGKLETPLVYVNDQGDFDSVTEEGFISTTSRTRAFLKVQEGCNYFCSYCIIPFARGRARSRSYQDSIDEAQKIVDKGFKEIVLTGINIGTYKYSNGRTYRLADLLDGMQNIKGIERIRISSIEPNTVDDELLTLIQNSTVLCPHLHIPLQSGNDDQLKAMNRKYRLDLYQELMNRFTSRLPEAALGTDIIVGFPGETDEHFDRTLKFIQQTPFTYLHIFRYSERNGTAAAKMTHKIDPPVAKKRSQILHETGKKLKLDYYRRYIGKTLPVLFDQKKNDRYSGYTTNYIQILVESDKDVRNEIVNVRLEDIDEKGIGVGRLV